MKKRLLSIILTIIGVTLVISSPVFASCSQAQLDQGCVSTSILSNGCSCDNGKGDSIKGVLKLIVDIMTIGIGILGVVGISVVGIQYLTAGGNEEKTRKAKRRLFEIVIGLAIYVVMYALMYWLIPGFKGTDTGETPSGNQEVEKPNQSEDPYHLTE